MPKAVKTTTTSTPVAGPSRRRLAGAAALMAVFGSAGPFAGSAEAAEASGALASFEDYARIEYDAWPPQDGQPFGSCADWLEKTRADYLIIAMAVKVMERDHLQNAAIASSVPDNDMIAFCEALQDLHERYRGLAEMLQSAQIRVIAGMSRNLIEAEHA